MKKRTKKNIESRSTHKAPIVSVPLGDMRIPDEYRGQRPFDPSWAKRLLADIDLDAIGKLTVNHRHHGKCRKYTKGCPVWVQDGQHRRWVLIEWLGDGWESQCIECELYDGLSEQQEAEVFLKKNTYRAVNSFSRFANAVFAGRSDEVAVDRVVRSAACVVSKSDQTGSVSCVGTLLRIYRRSDGPSLKRALLIATGAFGDAGLQATVIDGIAYVCGRYNGALDDEKCIEKLNRMRGGVGSLRAQANVIREMTHKPLAQCLAAAVVEIVNKGRGGKKLPAWWKTEG